MNLDPTIIAYMLNVVKTARLVGIESIIIEPGFVRAMDESNSVVLFQEDDVMDMPFGSIGMTRLDEFMARYELARTQEKFSITADAKDDTAKSIIMKGKGVKIDYRCGDPVNIKAPRKIKDSIINKISINEEVVNLLQGGYGAMKSESVTIICNNDGVSFEMADVNNDVFKHTFSATVENLIDGSESSFAWRYPTKMIISLFKQNPNGSFSIGEKGILRFQMNGLTLFVLPQV